MNDFQNHFAFYLSTFAHWRPQEGGGQYVKSRYSPPPSRNYKTTSLWGAVPPPLLWGLFSPWEVGSASFLLFGGLVFLFGGHFLHVGGGGGGGFSLCEEIFRFIFTYKNFYCAHALDARVVASIWRLGEI